MDKVKTKNRLLFSPIFLGYGGWEAIFRVENNSDESAANGHI